MIKTDEEKNNSTGWNLFYNKKTNDSKFIDWNSTINNLMNKIINMGDKVNKSLDVLQNDLNILGLGLDCADIINSLIYTARGDYGNAALSGAACIPVVGNFATGGKAIKAIDKTGTVAKTVGKISDIAKGTKKGSKVTDAVIEGGSSLGKLKSIGKGAWESTEGLIYEQGSKQGNRVLHVLEHTVPDPSKPLHTVFNVGKDKVLGVVDEAWSMRDSVTPILQKNGNQVFDITMGKIVGTNGETTIRIVVENGTSKIVTSFPVK